MRIRLFPIFIFFVFLGTASCSPAVNQSKNSYYAPIYAFWKQFAYAFSKADMRSMWRDFWRLKLDYGSKRYKPSGWGRTPGGANRCAYFRGIPKPSYWDDAKKASWRVREPYKHIDQNFPIPCPNQYVPETVSRTMKGASADEKYYADLYLFMRELAGIPPVAYSQEYAAASKAYVSVLTRGSERTCKKYPHRIEKLSGRAKREHDRRLARIPKPAESMICAQYYSAWDALIVGWTAEYNTHFTGHFKMHYAATNKRFGVAYNPRSGAWVAKFAGDWPRNAIKFLQQN